MARCQSYNNELKARLSSAGKEFSELRRKESKMSVKIRSHEAQISLLKVCGLFVVMCCVRCGFLHGVVCVYCMCCVYTARCVMCVLRGVLCVYCVM